MEIDEIRDYCLTLGDVSEHFPFDDDTLVFKTNGKMFVLISLSEQTVNLKCDPELAVELRETYSYVIPGYHMNKKHWNTILEASKVPNNQLKEWINYSYRLVSGTDRYKK